MPRSGPSAADAQLIAEIAAFSHGRIKISIYQLERWRRMGVLPRNHREWVGRGRGSVSYVPPETFARVYQLGVLARQGRRNPFADPLFAALGSPSPAADEKIRAAALDHLAWWRHRLGSDDDRSSIAADRRSDIAAAIARRTPPQFPSSELLTGPFLGDLDGGEMPRYDLRSRAATFQLLAGGAEEVAVEDFAGAIGASLDLAPDAVKILRTALGEAAEPDWWHQMPGLADLERALRATSAERVRRAVLAAYLARNLPFAYTGLALIDPAAREHVARLQAHPFWAEWAGHQTPDLNPNHLPRIVAFSSAALLYLPGMLESAEEFTALATSFRPAPTRLASQAI